MQIIVFESLSIKDTSLWSWPSSNKCQRFNRNHNRVGEDDATKEKDSCVSTNLQEKVNPVVRRVNTNLYGKEDVKN